MPFVNGRYHMNPAMGQALEAAREAELIALQQQARGSQNAANDIPEAEQGTNGAAPIHRVEIEAAETVPNSTGRATRGFVARIHRASTTPTSSPAPSPETHVFADHRDLANFLRDSLAP